LNYQIAKLSDFKMSLLSGQIFIKTKLKLSRVIINHISGMIDQYTLKQFEKITDENGFN
jgi:dGTP triphosphohydrolase